MSTVVFQGENLPDGWLIRTLGEFVAQRSVGILPSKTPSETFELYSVPSHEAGSPEIVAGREIGSNKQVVEEGTVLLCKINPRINRTWVVSSFSKHQKIASTEWITFPHSNAFEPKFLAFYLRQDVLRDFLAANASGVGGSLMRVKPSTVSDYPVPLAPLNEQTRIVAEIENQFSRLDEAVANLKRVKANLKRYKAAVLKAAVEGKLTEVWRRQYPDVEPADKLLERILAERRKAAGKGKYKEPVASDTSGLPELPAGWVWAQIETVADMMSGHAFKKDEYSEKGIRLFQIANVSFGFTKWDEVEHLPESYKKEWDQLLLKEGDVLMALNRPLLSKELKIAKLRPNDVPAILYQRVGKFLFYDKEIADYFLVFMQSPYYVNALERQLQGVNIPFINKGVLLNTPMPLPQSLREMKAIVAEIERRLSIVTEAEAEVDNNLRRADRLRQSILKQAFSGQLVFQDPNDEPASVLLERIRANADVGATRRVAREPIAKQGRGTASPLQKSETKPAANDFPSLDAVLTAILVRMQPGQEYSRVDLADPLGLSAGRWNAAIQELKRRGQVRQMGEKRGARYIRA